MISQGDEKKSRSGDPGRVFAIINLVFVGTLSLSLYVLCSHACVHVCASFPLFRVLAVTVTENDLLRTERAVCVCALLAAVLLPCIPARTHTNRIEGEIVWRTTASAIMAFAICAGHDEMASCPAPGSRAFDFALIPRTS